MTMHLDLEDGTTFTTHDANWDGKLWNGFPAVQLPKWQGYLLGLLLGEHDIHPSLSADDEDDLVWMDGLTWYEA